MDLITKAIFKLSPKWALKRELAKRAFEAVNSGPHRKPKGSNASANASLYTAGPKLRAWARYLDENHDVAIGVLDVLVNNIVGTSLIVEPMVLQANGEPAEKINDKLRALWEDFCQRPEVTRTFPMGELQRLACRSWLRDGEVLAQLVSGNRPDLAHGSAVPLSLEMIEADLLPFELNEESAGLFHGVQLDSWNKPVLYWLYKTHPGDRASYAVPQKSSLKAIKAEDAIHIKHTKRFGQVRGVTIFHGVATRLEDIKDYEESERIAARVASNLTAYIKKSPELASITTNSNGDRSFEMSAGMVFDGLLPGEEVGIISSDRPNTGLADFVQDQMRRVACGTGTGASSISKRYDGNYSAQRQELVEQQIAYQRMREFFISIFMVPVYRRFVDMAKLAGLVSIPSSLNAYGAAYYGVGQPWIDPEKEINAFEKAVAMRVKSRHQVIREMGGNPRQIDDQIKRERAQDKADGITSDVAQAADNSKQTADQGQEAAA